MRQISADIKYIRDHQQDPLDPRSTQVLLNL